MPVTRSQATINGKPLTFETGKYAKQAGGAVTVQYGDTVVFAWSADQENDYDVLAVNAVSAALTISNAPFEGPIGCVRVGTVDGELTLNPTIQQMEESTLDLIVAGTRDSIMMMEAGAHEV